jgi:D-amino-acid dehydrogenase
MANTARDVAVVGGGITGITTAYALARRGVSVTVYERERYPAMATSYANGAQISACNAEVWNSWANVAKGIRWMLTPGAPLLVSPWPTWHKMSWMAEFVAAIPRHDANTVETTRLAIVARRRLLAVAEEEGIAFDLERRGILNVYETAEEHRAAAAVSRLLTAGGLERQEVSPAEIRALEPNLQGTFHGGFYTPTDYTGDIHAFTVGLARVCSTRYGVTFRSGTRVANVTTDGGGIAIAHGPADAGGGAAGEANSETSRHDAVVVCAGVASRGIAAGLGDRLNIYPVKGYSITVDLGEPADRAAAPWVSVLDDKAKIVSSRLGERRLRIAGTAELSGYDLDIRAARIAPLVAWCRKRYPGVGTRQVTPWAGLRPMMPDMMPRVAPGRRPGVYYNTGHGHLGWTLAAATAELTAVAITGVAEAPPVARSAPAAAA